MLIYARAFGGVMILKYKYVWLIQVILFLCTGALTGCFLFQTVNSSPENYNNQEVVYEEVNREEIIPLNPLFYEIDTHAINSPVASEKSVETLAQYLIEPAKNDLDKVRAIYRWITSFIAYDVESFFYGTYGDLSAAGVLRSRKSVCSGYANLFYALAGYANLKVVIIEGYAKGYGYNIGDDIAGDANHAWNAVQIDGEWHLIDSTWGAGYLNNENKFTREFQEHYFLTEPDAFIYDHFPIDSNWQLLKRTLYIRDYEQMVFVFPGFFNYGLSIVSHSKGIIKAKDEVSIEFKANKDVSVLCTLLLDNEETGDFISTQGHKDEIFSINIILPERGEYDLYIALKEGLDSAGVYDHALQYKIIAR